MKEDEFVPEWDVARDETGAAITVTVEQVRAIWNAIRIVEQVRHSERFESLWDRPDGVNFSKSRLLGRMLIDGLPPTKTKPPTQTAGPAWWLMPGGDPFAGDI